MRDIIAVCCLGGAFLSGALIARAQTQHPCDMAPSSGATATAGPVNVGWCHNGKDTLGGPITVTGWRLYRDNQPPIGVTATTNGVPSASGDIFYQATVTFPAGNFIVTIAAMSVAGEGGQTPPFSLNVTEASQALPSAPRLFRKV